MTNKEIFNGICPYTDKPCEEWNCTECEVEKAEQEYLTAREPFGTMRHLTPEENKEIKSVYKQMSTIVKGISFFD